MLFYINTGVRKTHLATSIRIKASTKIYLTYVIRCHDLIHNLRNACNKNILGARLKHSNKYKVLIIDEIGYLPT